MCGNINYFGLVADTSKAWHCLTSQQQQQRHAENLSSAKQDLFCHSSVANINFRYIFKQKLDKST